MEERKLPLCPQWVKLQKERFLWAKANDGAEIRALSPTCEETKKADMRAFCELCGHIARNNADGCVIGIQIENEPGLIGAARDYSPQSTKLFKGAHSADAAEFIGADGTWGDLRLLRRGSFSPRIISRTTSMISPRPASGYLTSHVHKRMAWRDVRPIPGTNYPSGGAVTKTFRFWKHLLKHVDAIARISMYPITGRSGGAFQNVLRGGTFSICRNPLQCRFP